MKHIFLYLLCPLLLASSAAADSVSSHMKPEWLACVKDSDCTYLTYNCSEHVAVNTTYSSTAEQALCSSGVGVSCSWNQCPQTGAPVVVCGDAHQCMTKWAVGTRTSVTKPATRR